jgi:membrane protease subunit HflC
MMSKIGPIAIILLIVAVVALSQSAYIVDQTEKAIVLQFGKPVSETVEPGLHFKKPFVQNVEYFDGRILEYDAKPTEILTKDKKNMLVDNYVKWRIQEPLQFFRTVRNFAGAQARLDDVIYAELRVALGRFTLTEVVNQKRAQIMTEVTKKSSELISEFGIEVIDVRIKRTDLPQENERAIFGRMRAERQRQAKLYRSEGGEEAAKIKSAADKERLVILADAERESAVLRGEGDAEAVAIFAEALNRSPEFYEFKRSMEAYEKSFQGNTKLIFTPSGEFFQFLK